MKHLLRYLSRYRGKMAFGLTIKIAGTLMDLVLPYILAHLIDDVVPEGVLSPILIWGGVMLVCAVLGFLGNVFGNRIASAVARDTAREMRHELFARVAHLSSRQIDEISVPSLESRLTSDTYNVHQMVGMMQRMGVRAPILLIGGLIVTFMTEPVLTLVIVAVLPFILVTVWLVTKRSVSVYTDVQKANEGMVRVVRENTQGVRIIKALSRGEHEKERFRGVNAHLAERETTAGVITSFSSPLMSLFLYLGQTGVIIVGAMRVARGLTQPGKIIAFLSYFTMILNAMLSVTRMFVMLSKGSASADRIGEILDIPEDLVPIAPTGEKRDALIEFDDVSFSYLGVKQNVEHISFRLEKGQSLGIIGATGSGKSTLILLLMRFYDVTSGRIFLDGKDVREYERGELLSYFGSVFQNDMVFGETIFGNIDLWRDLPKEALIEAAQTAQAEPFILTKPGQYEMEVQTAGTNLSGGQRQRLLIARALAAKPPILLFDDASSALDYKTDADLSEAIRSRLPGDTTRVTVTQRISSIMDCDLILVLDQGKIIGQGTHEDLLRTCEVYREISESQMGGVILDE